MGMGGRGGDPMITNLPPNTAKAQEDQSCPGVDSMVSRGGPGDTKNGDHGKVGRSEEEMRRGSSTAPLGRSIAGAGGGGNHQSSSYSIMNNTFRVDARYSGLKAIGKGSFGIVCSAFDEKQGKRVAIKKIHPMAQHVVDAKHVLREIRLMRYLGSHPNIVSLGDLFVSEHHDDLYIVMELLDSDLHRIIQSPQKLGDAHHRYFMFQLLRGVKFLHDNRIIHRDLKPGNVLVTKNCQLRITDFGLARLRPMGRGADPDDEVDHPMTEHVVTRWYRPPELMLCPDGLYGYAVDLWSVGCIFAELLGRQPLFPGKNFVDQLTLIFDVVGSPQAHEVAHIRNSQAKRFLESMQDRIKVPYAKLFNSASEQAVDLLEGLLVFDPPGRLSVDEALDHLYFQPLRRNDAKPDPEVAPGFEFDFESKPLCRVQLQKMILQEVESYQRAQRKRDKQARAAAAQSAASPANSSSSSSVGSGGGGGGGGGNKSIARDDGGSSSTTTAGATTVVPSDEDTKLFEEHDQQQQQRLRRQYRQAAAAAGSSSAGCGVGTRGTADRDRERAPISAVSSAQTTSEAATVRAGLGSHRANPSHSLWGPSGVGSAAAVVGGAPAATGGPVGGYLPGEVYNCSPSAADEKYSAHHGVSRVGGRKKTVGTAATAAAAAAVAAEAMDDDGGGYGGGGGSSSRVGRSTAAQIKTPPPGDDLIRSPNKLPPTPEYKTFAGGVVGHDHRHGHPGSGQQFVASSSSHWLQEGGSGVSSSRVNNGSTGYQHQDQRPPYPGVEVGGSQRPRRDNNTAGWPSAVSGVGGGPSGSLEAPVRIHRSSSKPTGGTVDKTRGGRAAASRGDGRKASNRGGATRRAEEWDGRHDGRAVGGEEVGGGHYQHHYRRGQQQQQPQPQQQQHVLGTKPVALQDVEDRFHRLNFERARYGRTTHGDACDPLAEASMRAPQR